MPRSRPALRPMSASLAGLLLLAVCLAGACTPKGTGKLDAPAAQAQWASFMAAGGAPTKAFTLSASLNLTAPQKSTRVLLKFWGNLDLPLRLDITASMGSTFAMWREDSLGWMALYPLANQAYTHPDTRKGLNRLGMPFPFGMKELAGVITGNFAAFLPSTYQSVKKTDKGLVYTLAAPCPVTSVTLDFEGKPIHLTGRGVEPWTVDLAEHTQADGSRPLAQKITLTTPGGVTAIFRVKKLELSADPMAAEALELPLPPQARHIPLERAGEVRAPDMP